MKRLLILIFILMSVPSFICSEKVMEIEESFKSGFLYADQNRLYLIIRDTNVINVYSRKDFSRLFQFGKKGEGPGEFIYVRSISSSSKDICIWSSRKIAYFSTSGKLLEEQKFPSRLNVDRVGNSFVGIKIIRDKPVQNPIIQYIVFDSKLNPVKVICEYENAGTWFVFGGGKKRDYNLVGSAPFYRISKNKIIIGDPRKGIRFAIYNEFGEKISEFSHDYKKEKITKEYKEKRMIAFKKSLGRRWDQISKAHNLIFPEYFPPFRYFLTDDQKIYAILHQTENDRSRMLIFDFKGNLIKKDSIISDHSGVICDNHYYYLKENEDTEMWELHREILL